MKLYEWLEKWLKEYKKEIVDEDTYLCYKYAIVNLKKVLEDKEIKDFVEIDLQISINLLKEMGYSKSTIQKVKIVLNQAFEKAYINNFVNINIAKDLRVPKNAKTKQVVPLTVEQQHLVELAALDDFNGHLMIFLLDTGLRRSEIINLKWENYDRKNCSISIPESKSIAGVRRIPVNKRANQIILNQKKINDYIFNSRINKPITISVLKKTYLRLRKKTGVKTLTNHVCRHTFATRLVENKANIIAVSNLLGHASTHFTAATYVTVDIEFLRENLKLGEEKE